MKMGGMKSQTNGSGYGRGMCPFSHKAWKAKVELGNISVLSYYRDNENHNNRHCQIFQISKYCPGKDLSSLSLFLLCFLEIHVLQDCVITKILKLS